MSRNGGCGFASLAAEWEKIDDGSRCEISRCTSNSQAKGGFRKLERKRWYEKDEISQQYLYCVKDPPCQTCCRYNERLFKTILESKRKVPPYKHKVTNFSHLRPRIYHGQRDEGKKKTDITPEVLYHGLQSSDVIALTRPVPPVHPQHAHMIDAPTPWFGREPCDFTKPSEAAARCPRPPSRDYFYGVEDTDVTATTRRIPPAVSPKNEREHGREFHGRPKTDVTNLNIFPTRIPEGISRYDAHPIGRSVPGTGPCRDCVPLARDASGRRLRPVSDSSPRPIPRAPSSQPPSPTKFQPKSPGKANWNEAEEKEILCRRSPGSKICTDRNQANGYEPKLQDDSSVVRPSLPKIPTNNTTSLHLLSGSNTNRVSEGNSWLESTQLPTRPASDLPPCEDRPVLARDSSGKLLEPPPIRNAISANCKPPRPPYRAQTMSPIQPPSLLTGRPTGREPLERRPICKHPPCKPCNLSCFDHYYSTSDFDTSYDKPCTLPDIFARRNNNHKLTPRHKNSKNRSGTPLWKAVPPKSSPWSSQYAQTTYGRVRDNSHSKARWKAEIERDIYSGPPKSQKRMYGKAQWKDMIDRELLAGR